jgi:SAM-dependent methyltransferase
MEKDQTFDPTKAVVVESVVDEWLDPHLPTVFSRWHDFHEACFSSISAGLIDDANIGPGDAVIDIGSGSGIPALAIAQTVGLTGVVVATDPSPIFLAAIEHNARHLGLTNVRAVPASVTSLPPRDGGFDAATCQMGVMFFPDPIAGLCCVRQVLRPGGRVAMSAWGPMDENTLFSSFRRAVGPYLPPEPEPSGAQPNPVDQPGPARFADSGSLSRVLREAGFVDIREARVQTDLVWPGRAETLRDFWQVMMRYEEKVVPDRLAACRADLLASLNDYADGDSIRLPATIVMVSGQA